MILERKSNIGVREMSDNLNQLMTNKSSDELAQIFGNMSMVNQLYKAGIREVSTKLETLDDEFRMLHDYSPIHHIESRLKTPYSIMDKLNRLGLEQSAAAAVENLTDIAGIRVICKYIEDVYRIAELLLNQDDMSLIKMSDYIKEPKKSGYRSLHIVVLVPVYLSNSIRQIPVEVQLRTIAMDFWSSLEYELRYKTTSHLEDSLVDELKECAEQIAEIDYRMQSIHEKINKHTAGELPADIFPEIVSSRAGRS